MLRAIDGFAQSTDCDYTNLIPKNEIADVNILHYVFACLLSSLFCMLASVNYSTNGGKFIYRYSKNSRLDFGLKLQFTLNSVYM